MSAGERYLKWGEVPRGNVTPVQATNTGPVQLVGPNENRVSLTIFPSTTAAITIKAGVGPVSALDITFPANAPPFVFDAEIHGLVVKGPWQVIAAAAATNLNVLEASLP